MVGIDTSSQSSATFNPRISCILGKDKYLDFIVIATINMVCDILGVIEQVRSNQITGR